MLVDGMVKCRVMPLGVNAWQLLVRGGLRLLRSRVHKRQSLLHALEVGHEAAEAGRRKPFTDELLRDIAARGRKLADARRPVSPLGTTVTDDIRAQMADPEFRRATAEYAVAEEVARVLIRFRRDRRLTQKDAAIELGMTESMVCRLERGDHVPNVKTMLRVAEATGTVLSLRFVKPK
jgi:ribosome-binding protein aMBF1 (putative translation factor)